MNKIQIIATTLILSLIAGLGNALAWSDLTRLTAGGKAKEVAVNRQISRLMIICQDAPVIINTVVVREGGKKTSHTIGKRFNVNEQFILEVGGARQVTGFRISDDLKGNYQLRVE